MRSDALSRSFVKAWAWDTLIGVAILAGSVAASANGIGHSSKFDEITARGRLLTEYQEAVHRAFDMVNRLTDNKSDLLYVAKRDGAGWSVAIGRLSPERDIFLVFYEADKSPTDTDFTIHKFDPPAQDSAYLRRAASAVRTALENFQGENRPYNVTVLPADKGQMYVYIIPSQNTPGVYVFGGDIRYLISDDGASVIEKHPMHKSIIIFGADKSQKQKPVAGVHTHILTDVPEDSDVSYVLSRNPRVPEFIKTRDHTFIVQVDGIITQKN